MLDQLIENNFELMGGHVWILDTVKTSDPAEFIDVSDKIGELKGTVYSLVSFLIVFNPKNVTRKNLKNFSIQKFNSYY